MNEGSVDNAARRNKKNAKLISSLRNHMFFKDRFLYNSLPETMQKDKAIAFSAVHGCFGRNFINEFNGGQRTYSMRADASISFLDDYGNFDYKTFHGFRDIVINLCKYRPKPLVEHVNRQIFRFVVKGICEVDSTFRSKLLAILDKWGYHNDNDDVYRLYILIWIWDVFQFPECILKEEHFIAVTFKQHDIEEDEIVSLRFVDIPERFSKGRHFYSFLEDEDADFRLMPQDLVKDKEFCLSFFRSTNVCSPHWHYDCQGLTDQLWRSLPETFRKDEQFYAQAVFWNIHVLYCTWEDGQRTVQQLLKVLEETPLKVFLSAIIGHGYKGTVLPIIEDRNYAFNVVDVFDKKIKSDLDRWDEYKIFLSGIVQSRREHCRCAYLRPIDFGDVETSIGIKKRIASFVGVPTGQYLVDLRKVSKLRRKFQNTLDAYKNGDEIYMSDKSESSRDHSQEESDDDVDDMSLAALLYHDFSE